MVEFIGSLYGLVSKFCKIGFSAGITLLISLFW